MTTTNAELDQQLADLIQQTRNVLVRIRQTNAETHKNLASIYLWWRDVRKIEGYLENKYTEQAITSYQTQGKINFRPLLKLLTNGDISRTNLGNWHKSLNAIHNEFESNPKGYAGKQAAYNIVYFIESNNGITGLSGYYKDKDDENEAVDLIDEVKDKNMIKHWLMEIDDSEFEGTFAELAKAYYRKSTTTLPLPKLPATNDGHSLVLVQNDGINTKLCGVMVDKQLIKKLLIGLYRNDFSACPLSLRTVLEPLYLLSIPHALPKDPDLFIEVTKLDDACIDGKKLSSYKRLTYRVEHGDFVVSNVGLDAGVVVIAKPIHQIFDNPATDLCLSRVLTKSIEIRLLHNKMFNMFSASSDTAFQQNPVGHLYPYQLHLANKLEILDEFGVEASDVIAHTSNYRHPPISFQPFYQNIHPVRWQVALKDANFAKTWRGELSLEVLLNAKQDFFAQWIGNYAKKHKRDENRTFQLSFLKRILQIGFELGDAGYGNAHQVEMPLGFGAITLQVRSTDFAFILHQLSDLSTAGNIAIAANMHGLMIEFNTEGHSYTCVIPACDAKGVRDATLFSHYTPKTITLVEDFDAEVTTLHLTDEDRELLTAQGILG